MNINGAIEDLKYVTVTAGREFVQVLLDYDTTASQLQRVLELVPGHAGIGGDYDGKVYIEWKKE